MKKYLLIVMCTFLSASLLQAFLPPQETQNDVILQILGFDEASGTQQLAVKKVDAQKPLAIQIILENKQKQPISGTFRAWLNDDWTIDRAENETITLKPGEKYAFKRIATAKKSVLPALYPLHATFSFQSNGKEHTLHPIAIFQAEAPLPSAQANKDSLSGAKNTVTIDTGKSPFVPMGEKAIQANQLQARERAHSALSAGADPQHGQFLLKIKGKEIGAGVVLGNQGIFDGTILFSDGKREILYRGFNCEVDSLSVGSAEPGITIDHIEEKYEENQWSITHWTAKSALNSSLPLRLRIWSDASALRMAWDMPGVQRNVRGEPRYTKLGLNAGSLPVWRAYAGFGNVIENPKSFTLTASGFFLSTRHIGGDYTNGMSLVQATDIFPDRLVCAADQKLYALQTHHDATFTFIPSTHGAFTAARAFRDLCEYKKGRGLKNLTGRIACDEWNGAYTYATKRLELAQKYGLTDLVFIKHIWQHWGYDYRLPEIYPPAGNLQEFKQMVTTAQNAGMLFCPHDNYIDFYPDAEGFSYDHIIFNPNGTPQQAWYNSHRKARSYRWLPQAFQPWLIKNMDLLREGFSPDSLFLDVFTAKAPMDYYDRNGKFYPKTETVKYWGNAFDLCRERLGKNTAMISEAGTDALMGYVDAGEADHFSADRWIKKGQYDQAVRVPWHDMVSHGKMILFGGGLENRYAGIDWKKVRDLTQHGYGSDDYFSNLIIGGRAPMVGSSSLREMVRTYWLLHDICKSLGEADLESHEFGETIFQQHTTFSNGGNVWSNRGTNGYWRVDQNKKLPQYGFYAKAPGIKVGIIEKNDLRSAFAITEDSTFVDARPSFKPFPIFPAKVSSSVQDANCTKDGKIKIASSWTIKKPLPDCTPFVHVMKAEEDKILFHGSLPISKKELATAGSFTKDILIHLPAQLPSGKYEIRYGLYRPQENGTRISIEGICDRVQRVNAGSLNLTKTNGEITSCEWEAPQIPKEYQGSNPEKRTITFDALATDGAFKLIHGQNNFLRRFVNSYHDWILIPLPGSLPFKADISLEAHGAKGAEVGAITLIDPLSPTAKEVSWSQSEDCLSIECDAKAFAYRIEFK